MNYIILFAFISLIGCFAFKPYSFKLNFGKKLIKSQISAKPDLFSDDLFGDDEEEPPSKKIVKQSPETPKKKYLDEKWTLSPEDSKEFKGFPNNNPPEDVEPSENVPCFALMYKFRKEYLETSVDATLADHRGHCTKFKRLLNSEVINMGKAKGVVLLWAGFTEEDKKETKAEIMSFLEEDPLVMKDVVETWDIIDLSASSPTAALPSA